MFMCRMSNHTLSCRTAVNAQSGVKTPAAGIITGMSWRMRHAVVTEYVICIY